MSSIILKCPNCKGKIIKNNNKYKCDCCNKTFTEKEIDKIYGIWEALNGRR